MTEQLNPSQAYTDFLISDFLDPRFQRAFQRYFAELGIQVRDWAGLFREMDRGDAGEKNAAYVRQGPEGGVIGFILFIPIRFTSWFFEGTCGFIREFWVAEEYRGRGHGSALLDLAETWFVGRELYAAILTTNTAKAFYQRRGYAKAFGCRAKNQDDVFLKKLK